jgi:hypothetical protein
MVQQPEQSPSIRERLLVAYHAYRYTMMKSHVMQKDTPRPLHLTAFLPEQEMLTPVPDKRKDR